MATTTRTRYRTRLLGTDEEPIIQLVAEEVSTIIDAAGRRQRTKEIRRDAQIPDVVLAELSMAQAAGLLSDLADTVGFMAVPSNRAQL